MRAFLRFQARAQRVDDGVVQVIQPRAQTKLPEREQGVPFRPLMLRLVIQLDHRARANLAVDFAQAAQRGTGSSRIGRWNAASGARSMS